MKVFRFLSIQLGCYRIGYMDIWMGTLKNLTHHIYCRRVGTMQRSDLFCVCVCGCFWGEPLVKFDPAFKRQMLGVCVLHQPVLSAVWIKICMLHTVNLHNCLFAFPDEILFKLSLVCSLFHQLMKSWSFLTCCWLCSRVDLCN